MLKEVYCPCTQERLYHNCCQPYHNYTKRPNSAEQLMRSRYSAYALNLIDYIIKTWDPSTCPHFSANETYNTQWMKLIINRSWENKATHEAFVDFDAFYEQEGQMHRMHEISRFTKKDGGWLYLDGKVS